MPSSPPVIPLNFMARTHMSWPKARCNMAKAVTLTLTTMGHMIMARRIAEKGPIRNAANRGNPLMCVKARAVA